MQHSMVAGSALHRQLVLERMLQFRVVYSCIDPAESVRCLSDVDLSQKQAYRHNPISGYVPNDMDIDIDHICTIPYLIGFNTEFDYNNLF